MKAIYVPVSEIYLARVWSRNPTWTDTGMTRHDTKEIPILRVVGFVLNLKLSYSGNTG